MTAIAVALVAGLGRAMAWPGIALLLVGVLIGAAVGILPGLSGAAMLAMALPFAIGLSPTSAFALMIGIATVTATTGDLTSILLGVPGEPGSAATIVDGHPMARRGEAARAMGRRSSRHWRIHLRRHWCGGCDPRRSSMIRWLLLSCSCLPFLGSPSWPRCREARCSRGSPRGESA